MGTILQMMLGGSALILIVLMFRSVLSGRVPRRFFVFLWLCVIVRLLLPFSVPVKRKPVLWEGRLRLEAGIETETGREKSPYGNHPYSFTEEPVSGKEPYGKTDVKTLFILLRTVWIAVSLSLAAAILARHRRWMKKYRASLPGDAVKTDGYAEWKANHRWFRPVQIRVSDQLESPVAYGLFRPVILLPAKAVLDKEELQCILEHEWAHIKNRDILTKYLMYAVLCIYWFHPLIWLMASYLNRDMELACDEAVLGSGLHSREDYALLLLRMADKRSSLWQSGVCFTKYSEMEERIRAIMKKRNYTWKAGALAAVVMACMIPAFTSAKRAEPTKQPEILQEGAALQDSLQTEDAAQSEDGGKEILQEVAKNTEQSQPAVSGGEIARLAKNYIGNPYQWGGSDLETGVDSSGFVKAIYGQMGIELPHSSEGLISAGTEIGVDEIREGDVILYGKEDENHEITPLHAAIYIGDKQVIHASNVKEGVKVSEIGYRPFLQAVRIIH